MSIFGRTVRTSQTDVDGDNHIKNTNILTKERYNYGKEFIK